MIITDSSQTRLVALRLNPIDLTAAVARKAAIHVAVHQSRLGVVPTIVGKRLRGTATGQKNSESEVFHRA